jgi:RNA polymerase sigma-54 factor
MARQKLSLQQKMLQKLSPQQIQLMKLIQLPTMELEQRIKEELEVNPALDEGKDEDEIEPMEETPDEDQEVKESLEEFDYDEYMDDEYPEYKLYQPKSNEEEKQLPIRSETSFREQLETQARLAIIGEKNQLLARQIIGSLDDDGYLRRDLKAIANDLAFTQNIMTTPEELEKILKIIQQLDPPGIAARNLQECLILQLKRKDLSKPSVKLALEILQNHFEEFTKKHYEKILQQLDIDESQLKDAIKEILKLNPKPGMDINESDRTNQQIIPDFSIMVDDDKLEVTLNSRNLPDLKISKAYKEMLEKYMHSQNKSRSDKDALMFIKQKIDSAKWFIDALHQRYHTLLSVMETIAEYQKEYFLTGDETKLKPMILKDIADITGLDISTISRVANSKYVQTPYGTFLLKSLFSESLTTESGEEVSTSAIKSILQELIDNEDKRNPLTDEEITQKLKEKGYNIARRTVAKYREQLGIPVARLRKEL